MKKIFGIFVVGVGLLVGTGGSAWSQASVRHDKFQHGRAHYHVAVANLSCDTISVETIHEPGLSNAWTLTARTAPAVALTGTFFDPRTGTPVGDVLVDGELTAQGARGSVLAVDEKGRVQIFDSGYKQRLDWTGFRFGLRGLVRVIRDGVVCPDPKSQKFRDSRIWGRAARTAAGITEDGRLVLMATRNSVTLSELGRAMKTRAVVDAIALDGGGSTCFYYRGEMLIKPQRRLSNMLIVREGGRPRDVFEVAAESNPLRGFPAWYETSGWYRSR